MILGVGLTSWIHAGQSAGHRDGLVDNLDEQCDWLLLFKFAGKSFCNLHTVQDN